MLSYSLSELQQYIRQVLALNFAEPLWITAEIGQVSRSRGHLFLDLVQKGPTDDSDVEAQAQAVLWQREYQRLRLAQGRSLDDILQEGREVRLQVRVDYHERYGLKLVLADIDPAYTFGRIEQQRRQTIETLRDLGLLEKNRALALPVVLQRIAVISSEGAAGFQDFREQLAQNQPGFAFQCRLFSAAVQGLSLESEIIAAMKSVTALAAQFDCVVVLRGGGARLDLAGFDRLELCKKAAELPLPLLTGIGHETDESVLDLVAHSALKTPTAVAEFLIQHNRRFEEQVLRLAAQIRDSAVQHLKIKNLELGSLETALAWGARAQLAHTNLRLKSLEEQLPKILGQRCRQAAAQLDQAEALCIALHPDAALRRGFSLTLKAGKVLRSSATVQPGDQLETRLGDGVVWSAVS